MVVMIRPNLNFTDCGRAPSISNGTKSTSNTTFDTFVYYTCNTGYISSGSPNYVYCQSNAQWTSSSYTCTIKGLPNFTLFRSTFVTAKQYNQIKWIKTRDFCHDGYTISDEIDNMDHMHKVGIEPSSVILHISQTKYSKVLKCNTLTCQTKLKQNGVVF